MIIVSNITKQCLLTQNTYYTLVHVHEYTMKKKLYMEKLYMEQLRKKKEKRERETEEKKDTCTCTHTCICICTCNSERSSYLLGLFQFTFSDMKVP